MMETPNDLLLKLKEQWQSVNDMAFIEESPKKRIGFMLAEVERQVDICEQYISGHKSLSGEYAAMEFGDALLKLPRLIKALNKTFKGVADKIIERQPELQEDTALLFVLTNRLGTNIRETYRYDNSSLPKRSEARAHHHHPEYPVYPDGALSRDELAEIYQLRSKLQIISQAGELLEGMQNDNPAVELIRKLPEAASIVGLEATNHRELQQKLQSSYADTYNKGVATLSRSLGIDGAESQMLSEVMAIDDFSASRGIGR